MIEIKDMKDYLSDSSNYYRDYLIELGLEDTELGDELNFKSCHSCFGTGMDKYEDADCLTCWGDGVVDGSF
jgi:DnaJ-class molecular chaperone